MRLMLAAVVVTAACLLMQIWNFDARALGLTVIVLAAIALILSGLYRSLHMEHMNADAVFGALPLPARWWVWPDTITMVAIGLPFVFLLCGVLLAQAYAWSVTWKLLVADVVLLVGLRFPQAYARRHAVVGAAGMAAFWCAPTMAAVL